MDEYDQLQREVADSVRRTNKPVLIQTDLIRTFALLSGLHVTLREGGKMEHLPSFLIEFIRDLEKEFDDIPMAKKYFDILWDDTIDKM